MRYCVCGSQCRVFRVLPLVLALLLLAVTSLLSEKPPAIKKSDRPVETSHSRSDRPVGKSRSRSDRPVGKSYSRSDRSAGTNNGTKETACQVQFNASLLVSPCKLDQHVYLICSDLRSVDRGHSAIKLNNKTLTADDRSNMGIQERNGLFWFTCGSIPNGSQLACVHYASDSTQPPRCSETVILLHEEPPTSTTTSSDCGIKHNQFIIILLSVVYLMLL